MKTRKEKRIDMKEEVFKLIKANSEDGLLECEIIEMFDNNELGIGSARAFIQELQIEKRIVCIKKGRIKLYKVNKNAN
jgi:hypothetical protein